MTSVDTIKVSAKTIFKETALSDLHEILEEINLMPEGIFERMGTSKEAMRKEAMKTLKAVEEL